jgi:hypothetical protein
MRNAMFCAVICVYFFFTGCRKESTPENSSAPHTAASSFKEFLIAEGEHYCNNNEFTAVETAELKFTAKFDSSAVYTTLHRENQYDINKLYGFADNGTHHQQYSARIGWRWSDGALRLFAYTYNKGVRDAKELGVFPLGTEISCSIKVTSELYVFVLNGKMETMPRLSATPVAKGYRLYPYFGGDEAAPHAVRIWIREEK